MMLNGLESIIAQAEQAFREIGYEGDLLQRDYTFADASPTSDATYTIPFAAFAQTPPTYRTACFGIAPLDGRIDLSQYLSLGAPYLFRVGPDMVRQYVVTPAGAPELIATIDRDEVSRTIENHRDEWNPEAMLRAKTIRFDLSPRQLDLYDIGLVPAIDVLVRQKLDRLLRDALAIGQAVYHEQEPDSQLKYEQLYRLVFRLLAAKILSDRGQSGKWQQDDPQVVLEAVEKYYHIPAEDAPALDEPHTQRRVWDKIRRSIHLQNISLDVLAYVYENTLVNDEQRRELGIHNTPPRIADYLVSHLPFERIPQDQRRVFDPFLGHGALLIAALDRLRTLLPPAMDPEDRHHYLVSMLAGIDIDPFAVEVAYYSLIEADSPQADGWHVLYGNVFRDHRVSDELAQARIVVCNPPFGSFTARERLALRRPLRTRNTATIEGQKPYRLPRSPNKAAAALLRVLEQPPDLLGFVLPKTFVNRTAFKEARERLIATYGSIHLLALPDNAFQHADVEAVLLMAYGKRESPIRLRIGSVAKADYPEFLRSGRPSEEREVTLAPSTLAASPTLWPPVLDRVWEALARYPILADVADIHRGIEYKYPMRTHREELISEVPKEGFSRGLARVTGAFEPYITGATSYLNMDPSVMKYAAYQLPWGQPKVLINAARRSRGPWRLTAAPDHGGLVAYQRFQGVWLRKTDLPLTVEVLAAVLNGPIANAFVSVNSVGRDNRIETIEAIPVPRFTVESIDTITQLVTEYQELRRSWLTESSGVAEHGEKCRRIMDQIDAEVLTAYDLPPRLEREVLDYFTGAQRPVPFAFTHYYPADFQPALPWRLFVSGVIERASARYTLERLTVLHDPLISETFAEIGQPVE